VKVRNDVTILHIRNHPFPAWGDVADGIAYVPAESDGLPARFFEELPTRRLGENYQICAVPLFARNLALGDVVAASPDDEGRLIVTGVVQNSGRFDYRVWFGNVPEVERREMNRHVVERLTEIGCLIEHYSSNFIGVDAPDEVVAREVVGFLLEHRPSGIAIEAANE